jgi:hypothetical protein
MNAPTSITITPVRVADLLAEGERMPVYVHDLAQRLETAGCEVDAIGTDWLTTSGDFSP